MNENAQAQALSDALDAFLRGGEVVAPQGDDEVRDLADLGRALSDQAPAPSAVHSARIERLLLAHRADLARAASPASRARARRVPLWDALRTWGSRLNPYRVPLALGTVAVAAIAVLLVFMSGGFDPSAPGGGPGGTAVADLPTATMSLPATPTSEPTKAQDTTATPRPTKTRPPTTAATPVPPPIATPTPTVVPPHAVVMANVHGIVQVRDAEGVWSDVSSGSFAVAGARVRTGVLSGVTMSFYDGSVVRMGPNAQLSIEHLDPALDGARVIELVQWLGEVDHDVAEATGFGARYTVRTPSGTGSAVGTRFQVRVTPALIAYFGVREGAVQVSNLDSTVIAVAGQVTAVRMGAVPDRPAFRVSGEGQVTETGRVWQIAGQPFVTGDGTTFVGDAQSGDWVAVDGRLDASGTHFADRIVLLHHTPVSRFSLTGEVGQTGDDVWQVAGQTIAVDKGTEIEPGIASTDTVHVDGTIASDGTLLAETIALVGETPGETLSFAGVLQETGGLAWTVSGIALRVDGETILDDGLLPGEVVGVRAEEIEDGARWARSIERLVSGKHKFEFTGPLQDRETWTVAGIAFETRLWTEIEPDLELGELVHVEGLVLEDGTWVADEIHRADGRARAFEFTGTVDQMEPAWIVSGITLTVDAETEVVGAVDEESLVKVEGQITEDGEWLAHEIKAIAEVQTGAGCIQLVSVVLKASARRIVLSSGAEIALDEGVVLEGKPVRGSVVEMWVCVDSDGQPRVVSITVIHHVDPDTLEAPPDDIAPPPPSPEKEHKITICHKPETSAQETLVVDQSAVPGHLAHGDKMGACPAEEEKPKPEKPPKPTPKDKDKDSTKTK